MSILDHLTSALGRRRPDFGTPSTDMSIPAVAARSGDYPDVDVAIVMESTYPYLKGGVSAVVHDIVVGNPDIEFGIIHIAWDSNSPLTDLYDVPSNVKWVRPVFLALDEHRHDFSSVRPEDGPLWELLEEGMLESTRTYPLWALLGTREFMEGVSRRLPGLGMSLSDAFWLLRNYFSLAHAVLGETMPRARVYHAHTTGYASLMSAGAAREHGTSFLLTEHNLYVRDTVNTLLRRNMALPIASGDYRTFDVSAEERAWMTWWIEMGHFCYPSAKVVTYLYPSAIAEAASLGSMSMLRESGHGNVHLHVLGPTEHDPGYRDMCLQKIKALDLEDMVTIYGTVNVREMLHEFDLLVLPSYNEGQPIVVLEAMVAGIPTVGTNVGGTQQLIWDDLKGADDQVYGPCGQLLEAGDTRMMADGIRAVISDPERYRAYSQTARDRVQNFFQLHEVMASYNQLYRMLGGIPGRVPASLYLEDYELLDRVDGPLAAVAQQADESAVSQLDTVFDLAAIRESGHRR